MDDRQLAHHPAPAAGTARLVAEPIPRQWKTPADGMPCSTGGPHHLRKAAFCAMRALERNELVDRHRPSYWLNRPRRSDERATREECICRALPGGFQVRASAKKGQASQFAHVSLDGRTRAGTRRLDDLDDRPFTKSDAHPRVSGSASTSASPRARSAGTHQCRGGRSAARNSCSPTMLDRLWLGSNTVGQLTMVAQRAVPASHTHATKELDDVDPFAACRIDQLTRPQAANNEIFVPSRQSAGEVPSDAT